jgi:hypothetical protein
VGLVAVAIPLIAPRAGQPDAPGPGVASSNPVVGGDLHSLVVDPTDPNTLYIGSHQGVSVSTDGGNTWRVEATSPSDRCDQGDPGYLLDAVRRQR